MRNLSHLNQLYLQVHSSIVNQTHYHMKGFALGLALKQRQKATRKWAVGLNPARGNSSLRREGGAFTALYKDR